MGIRDRIAAANEAARTIRDEGAEERAERREELRGQWRDLQQSSPARQKLSDAQTDEGLACPECGGTQFTANRSVKGKLAGGLLAPKSQVKCVACGAMFKRG